ncbi:fimbrial biogenesis chaperone [Salinicola aestuarinus]|uniref:fimbrial biogenesis chaperone n=1 Tax=Salinicola aestuarinus TaxID=1949082 RepID=UPI000DA1E963|nr:molecular chaperone [Salinicola aestuarinus]
MWKRSVIGWRATRPTHPPSPRLRRWCFALLVALTALMSLTMLLPTASAASLLLWPVHPVFEADEPAAALWVENRSEEKVWLQVRVVGWEQREGENRYPSQLGVVASPPMMEIGSGERHLIRLVRESPTPAGKEEAWRIILDEIPMLESDGTDGQRRAGVNLQMRYSLPLFSHGEGLADHDGSGTDLRWRIVEADGQTQLEVTNRGERHARLTAVAGHGPNGSTIVAEGLLGYVLAGGSQRWPLSGPVSFDSVTAKLNGHSPVTLPRDGE